MCMKYKINENTISLMEDNIPLFDDENHEDNLIYNLCLNISLENINEIIKELYDESSKDYIYFTKEYAKTFNQPNKNQLQFNLLCEIISNYSKSFNDKNIQKNKLLEIEKKYQYYHSLFNTY